MKARVLVVLAVAAFVVLLTPVGSGLLLAQDPPQSPIAALVSQLEQQSGGAVRVAQHSETGKVRFVGADPRHPLPRAVGVTRASTPEQAARGFLASYGASFGLRDQASELAVSKQRSISDGRSVVRFQQRYRGIPVLAGEMNVQLDADKNVLSANGEILPDLSLDTTAKVSPEQAQQVALQAVAEAYQLKPEDLTTTTPELWVYNPALLGGPGPRLNTLVWRMDVTTKKVAPVRELVLVDARLGQVTLQFNQVDTARYRLTYTANNSTTLDFFELCNELGGCTTIDPHAVKAHEYAGSTYDMYWTEYGRDSINGAGMTIKSTVHYDSGYANAFWDGKQMVYGDAYAFPLEADVVAHELTHGVTQYESGLFYYYQSGAINEALSDLWGEYVDQYYASDGSGQTNRWLIGEDIPGLGALRSMAYPTLFGHPDKMSSPNYVCTQSEVSTGDGDNGGVHANSGINNKAVYLMSDGGTFNGKTVTGIGYQKVAKLYYEVQTNLLLSGSDYNDLYDLLLQAADNLGFIANEKASVKNALDAVEMNQQPTACGKTVPAVCPAGQTASVLFADDMESGSSKWVHGYTVGGDNWYLPQNPIYVGWDVTYATSGTHNIWGFGQIRSGNNVGVGTSDSYIAMSSSVVLPPLGNDLLSLQPRLWVRGELSRR